MIPTLTITTAVDGTKENAFCSNRGLCDRTSGICACFMSFFSSDGNGNIAECSNAGTCDRSKGECVCDPRFTGASCNRSDGINSISITFRTVFGTLPTIRTTVNGVTSVTVKNDGTGGSVVGTKEDAVCSNRGTCDTLHGICICAEGFTSSDGYGGPGGRGDCGYMEPVYLNSAAKVANEIA
ncbi:hypothetical protein DYB30_005291 [Aphanomyces astaci]|uniref:EGF-like domain-containing protein n=2 Tax=Aphanomyces astaci TaxID=112090 RepID=A0A397CL16_APHAT|nr:hypothetical protein DYB30_005291 [Aphanomyces astaci]RHZ11247.1 hypothetical protein DYB31_004396 [Aphanomyces astaci]